MGEPQFEVVYLESERNQCIPPASGEKSTASLLCEIRELISKVQDEEIKNQLMTAWRAACEFELTKVSRG